MGAVPNRSAGDAYSRVADAAASAGTAPFDSAAARLRSRVNGSSHRSEGIAFSIFFSHPASSFAATSSATEVLVHLIGAAGARGSPSRRSASSGTTRSRAARACSRALSRIGSSCFAASIFSGVATRSLQPGVVLQRRAAAAWPNALAVLAGEHARGERAPDGRAVAELVVQRRILVLDAAAHEQVVLRLLHHRRRETVLFGDAARPRGSRRRSTRWCPSRRSSPAGRACRIARTVSSIGVSGSGRWQKHRSR